MKKRQPETFNVYENIRRSLLTGTIFDDNPNALHLEVKDYKNYSSVYVNGKKIGLVFPDDDGYLVYTFPSDLRLGVFSEKDSAVNELLSYEKNASWYIKHKRK